MIYNSIYFDPNNQKVRWTQKNKIALTHDKSKKPTNYTYIGEATRVEFDLLVELLWYKFEDDPISLIDFKSVFDELRLFCDHIKINYKI